MDEPTEKVVVPEEKVVVAPVVEEKVVPPVEKTEGEPAPKPVTRAEGEDAERFNLRQQLKVAQTAFQEAGTEEEKSIFKQEMKKIRQNLFSHDTDKPKVNAPTVEAPVVPTEDEEKAISANLKKLGFLTAEDMEKKAADIVKQTLSQNKASENEAAHGKVIDDFYKSRPDIASDKDLKEGIEAFVVSNFKISPLTPPETLAQYLTMAANHFVPPVQKVNNAKNAQDKVALVDFSGTGGEGAPSTEKGSKEERAYLKNTLNWSDAKIESFYK
jgi:hypothetical protein